MYFREKERERVREARERQREANSVVSTESDGELDLTTHDHNLG